MQHDHDLNNLKLDLVTPFPRSGVGGSGVLRAAYLLPCCCIHDALLFDKQHDHVLKKLKFDLLTPSTGSGGEGGGGVCGQNICYNVVAFVKFFNSICNMTMF